MVYLWLPITTTPSLYYYRGHATMLPAKLSLRETQADRLCYYPTMPLSLPQLIQTERVPIYVYALIPSIEPDCLQQAKDIANLEPAFHHVALMPDAHIGYGMPIGGILALKDAVCPNAVGVDIGCGMGFVPTTLTTDQVTKENLEKVIHQIMRSVPTGFNKHKQPQPTPDFLKDPHLPPHFDKEVDKARYSIGTLGGGNHFINLMKDDQGKIYVMLHSGSRHFGFSIANYYHKLAQQRCADRNLPLPASDLAYLDTESPAGQEYIYAMNLALDFARENRRRMMDVVQAELDRHFGNVEFGQPINTHHNYAALETHFGEEVWIHRKGAIRAEKDEPVIVPGSMATPSYIGVGLGNPDGFNSCAHGAGRIIGRKEAKRRYTIEDILKDIAEQGIVLGQVSHKDLAEEARFSYKDIEEVVKGQKDLAKMELKLFPIAVIIG